MKQKATWSEVAKKELKQLYELYGSNYAKIAETAESFKYNASQVKNGIHSHILKKKIDKEEAAAAAAASTTSEQPPVATASTSTSRSRSPSPPAKRQELERKFMKNLSGVQNHEQVISTLRARHSAGNGKAVQTEEEETEELLDEAEPAEPAEPMPAPKSALLVQSSDASAMALLQELIKKEQLQERERTPMATPTKGITQAIKAEEMEEIKLPKLDYTLKAFKIYTEKNVYFMFRVVPGLKPHLQWINLPGRTGVYAFRVTWQDDCYPTSDDIARYMFNKVSSEIAGWKLEAPRKVTMVYEESFGEECVPPTKPPEILILNKELNGVKYWFFTVDRMTSILSNTSAPKLLESFEL